MKIEEIIWALLVVILGVTATSIWGISRYLSHKSEKKMDDRSFIIRLPKSTLALGISSILMPFLLLLGMLWFEEDVSLGFIIFAFSFFGIMVAIGICLIVQTLLCKIIIQSNQITVYPIFRKPYTIEFKDIVSVKIVRLARGERVVVSTESKKFSVEYICIGYEHFVKLIHRKVSQGKICIR